MPKSKKNIKNKTKRNKKKAVCVYTDETKRLLKAIKDLRKKTRKNKK